MQDFERVDVDSYPNIHLFDLDLQLDFIDRDRLAPVAVGLEEMFETMISVMDGDMTRINERVDLPERQAAVIEKTSEDTLTEQRVLVGNISCSRAFSRMCSIGW